MKSGILINGHFKLLENDVFTLTLVKVEPRRDSENETEKELKI